MINKNNHKRLSESLSRITFDRLYKIEIEKCVTATCAPVKFMIYDIHDRTIEEIFSEINCILNGHSGKWKISIYYWDGIMRKPSSNKFMGHRKDFLYSKNPRGDLVKKLDPSFEIDLDLDKIEN